MKKIIFGVILCLLLLASQAWSALPTEGKGEASLSSITSLDDTDRIRVIDGTASKNVTWLVFEGLIKTYTDTLYLPITNTGIIFTGVISGGAATFPAASAGEIYLQTSDGYVGGDAYPVRYGIEGDVWTCTATSAEGTEAAVGASWNQARHAISMPDGERWVRMTSNTTGTPGASQNGYGFLNNVFVVYENAVKRELPSDNSIVSTTTATGNINLDGVSASNYEYSNGSTAATYTPVFTSLPGTGKIRWVTATFGGGSGVCTMTWTNVAWIGTAGAAATTTNKKSTYACRVKSTGAECVVVAEAY